MKRRTKLGTTVAVIGVVGVLLELSAYAVMRVGHLGLDPNQSSMHLFSPYRSHRLNPDYRYRTKLGSRVLLHSPAGFRENNEVLLKKESDTYRIIMMGA